MYKKDLYGKTIRKKIVFHGGFYMFGLIIALISGALMSIQGVFNTEVTKQAVHGQRVHLYRQQDFSHVC